MTINDLSRSLMTACAASLALVGCAATGTEQERVELVLSVSSRPPDSSSLSDYTRSDGWHVHLERASLQLGSVYLRGPKRQPSASWWRPLLPTAHAHDGHAQTLTEGQVMGEFLGPLEVDALAPEPLDVGALLSESGSLDRLSVMLGGGAASATPLATVAGYAERDGARVDFDCALRLTQGANETPKNLEERRRVDQVALPGSARVTEGANLTLHMNVWRWLERVDFDALAGSTAPCATPQSSFVVQWYLGLRRPEAFTAELKGPAAEGA